MNDIIKTLQSHLKNIKFEIKRLQNQCLHTNRRDEKHYFKIGKGMSVRCHVYDHTSGVIPIQYDKFLSFVCLDCDKRVKLKIKGFL